VGRGANLLLNVPPDTRGQINERDVAALTEFKRLRDSSFSDNLLKQASAYYEFARKDLSSITLAFAAWIPLLLPIVSIFRICCTTTANDELHCIILRKRFIWAICQEF